MLMQGSKAPDFVLYDTDRKEVHLKDIIKDGTVLVFYPGAFTGACTKEMCAFRDQLAVFNDLGGQVYGISVDSPAANKAFAEYNKLNFQLLCDVTRTVSKQYGGVHEDFAGVKGLTVAKRAVYILDADGTVRYSWVTDNPANEPDYTEIQKVLKQ